MNTIEEARRLFVDITLMTIIPQSGTQEVANWKLHDAILRLSAMQMAGSIFVYQEYETALLRQIRTHWNNRQDLGVVLENHAQFQFCLSIMKKSPGLRRVFQEKRIGSWTDIKNDTEIFLPAIQHYFELAEEWFDEMDGYIDLNSIATLSDIFSAPLPPRLFGLVDFYTVSDEGSWTTGQAQ